MPHSIHEVAEYITRFIADNGPTTGAAIGDKIARTFPEFQLKHNYRNLTDFLEQEAPQLFIDGRQGLDLVWEVAGDVLDGDVLIIEENLGNESATDTPSLFFDKVRFQQFKGLDLELSLDRLTVLAGANGSGKTSILQGIHYLVS